MTFLDICVVLLNRVFLFFSSLFGSFIFHYATSGYRKVCRAKISIIYCLFVKIGFAFQIRVWIIIWNQDNKQNNKKTTTVLSQIHAVQSKLFKDTPDHIHTENMNIYCTFSQHCMFFVSLFFCCQKEPFFLPINYRTTFCHHNTELPWLSGLTSHC